MRQTAFTLVSLLFSLSPSIDAQSLAPALGSDSAKRPTTTTKPTPTTIVAPTLLPTTATGHLPALGWNTWNAYGCNINEQKILDAAQDMVNLGLQQAGYEYVNIDDCWSNVNGRDNTTNRIVPDATKFPDGINGLASKIHNLGFKMGIYSDAGTKTCAGYPGSLGFEEIDAKTFSEWGIDYLKYDNCNVPSNWSDVQNVPPNFDWYNSNSAIRYRQMTAALDSVSRPIQFSICIWGDAQVWTWGARVGHSWRMTGDASASWNFISSAIANNAKYLNYVNFGAHNDMDMMEIGNGALTIEEQRTHFAAWAFMKSPILLGTDLSTLSSEEVQIVTNKELLAFHQDDTIGTPAKPISNDNPPTVYAGQSSRGTHVFIVNFTNGTLTTNVTFSQVPGLRRNSNVVVHDMWSSQALGTFSNTFNITLAAHDTAALLLT